MVERCKALKHEKRKARRKAGFLLAGCQAAGCGFGALTS